MGLLFATIAPQQSGRERARARHETSAVLWRIRRKRNLGASIPTFRSPSSFFEPLARGANIAGRGAATST